MATTNLGGTLPTNNASSDTWGTENNAFLTLVDAQFGPAFSATNAAGGAQTITTATLTKVTLGTELFDVGSYFASSRFTPLVAGTYRFFGRATVSGSGGGMTRGQLALKKNGSDTYSIFDINGLSGTGSTASMSGWADIAMNGSTDYVELFALGTVAGTVTIDGVSPSLAALAGRFLHT